jgi:N-acyl-D-aspartate/D-glutamate deacylase
MLDCAITGGVVIDGTGRPGVRADVGIRDGRIVAVGDLDEGARQILDAEGRVVAPGFVDVHTHYDAQVMWDPSLAPSSLHGVTTVIGGNCGFTIAPVSEESADYVLHMLACVEGMPAASLEGALDFGWRSFGDWLERIEGQLALNAGFLVGHSTIRKLVMRKAWQEKPTAVQMKRMAEIVDESIQAGALGFSSSWGETHRDHLGEPVPSRHAATEELVGLASVLRRYPGTMLEFIPPGPLEWTDNVVAAMTGMTVQAQRPLNWNLLLAGLGVVNENDARLAVADRAATQGGEIVALTLPVPLQLRINLLTTILYNNLSVWPQVLSLPFEEKLHALKDHQTRARLAAAVAERQGRPIGSIDFDRITVGSVGSSALGSLKGRLVGDIARERAISALDAFLDIATRTTCGRPSTRRRSGATTRSRGISERRTGTMREPSSVGPTPAHTWTWRGSSGASPTLWGRACESGDCSPSRRPSKRSPTLRPGSSAWPTVAAWRRATGPTLLCSTLRRWGWEKSRCATTCPTRSSAFSPTPWAWTTYW